MSKPEVVCTARFNFRGMFESNDCTVRAFSAATGIPYKEAHMIAKIAGRTDKKGFWSCYILKQALGQRAITKYEIVNMFDCKKAGDDNRSHNNGYPTLAQVMPLLQRGRYILESRRHALAVVDGKIFDNSRYTARLRITQIFEVIV